MKNGLTKLEDFGKFYMTFNILKDIKKLDKKKTCHLIKQWTDLDGGNFRQFVNTPTNSLMPSVMAIEL